MGKQSSNERTGHLLRLAETLRAFEADVTNEYRRLQGLPPWASLDETTRVDDDEMVKQIYASIDTYTDQILDECDTPEMNRLVSQIWDCVQDLTHIALRSLAGKERE